jgi:hypothetical protein
VIAADFTLAPHLAHRETVYMFPNPFADRYWATSGPSQRPDARAFEWVAVRPYLDDDAVNTTLAWLRLHPDFELVIDEPYLVLLRRASATTR